MPQIALLDADRKVHVLVDVLKVPEFRHRHEGAFYDLCDVTASDVVDAKGEVICPAGTRRYAWSGKV